MKCSPVSSVPLAAFSLLKWLSHELNDELPVLLHHSDEQLPRDAHCRVVAAPPADLAAGRIAVNVDGRTLALKRENVVAARSASPPRAAPASSAAAPTPASAPPSAAPPPPPPQTVEPSSVDDALPDFDPARGLDAVLSTDGRPAYAIVARALEATVILVLLLDESSVAASIVFGLSWRVSACAFCGPRPPRTPAALTST